MEVKHENGASEKVSVFGLGVLETRNGCQKCSQNLIVIREFQGLAFNFQSLPALPKIE